MNLYSNSPAPLVNIQSHIKLIKITSTDIMSVTDPSTHNLKSNPCESHVSIHVTYNLKNHQEHQIPYLCQDT